MFCLASSLLVFQSLDAFVEFVFAVLQFGNVFLLTLYFFLSLLYLPLLFLQV